MSMDKSIQHGKHFRKIAKLEAIKRTKGGRSRYRDTRFYSERMVKRRAKQTAEELHHKRQEDLENDASDPRDKSTLR
jgi:hypothetical protein